MPVVIPIPEMPDVVHFVYMGLKSSGTGQAKLDVVAKCKTLEEIGPALLAAGFENTAAKVAVVTDSEEFATMKLTAAKEALEKAEAEAAALALRKQAKAAAKAEADAKAKAAAKAEADAKAKAEEEAAAKAAAEAAKTGGATAKTK